MTTLTFVRHGETVANLSDVLQGNMDSGSAELTEKGVAQAHKARRVLAGRDFDICYCSTLRRARETADIIVSNQVLEIVEDARLNEMDFGDGNLVPLGEWLKLHPPLSGDDWRFDYIDTPFPNGESYTQCYERVAAFGRDCASKEHNRTLLVGHTSTVRMLLAILKEQDLRSHLALPILNCAVYEATLTPLDTWTVNQTHP